MNGPFLSVAELQEQLDGLGGALVVAKSRTRDISTRVKIDAAEVLLNVQREHLRRWAMEDAYRETFRDAAALLVRGADVQGDILPMVAQRHPELTEFMHFLNSR